METIEALGKYEIKEKLGKGGMGQVYRARDPDLDHIVAIKRLLREGDELDRRRLRREPDCRWPRPLGHRTRRTTTSGSALALAAR